MTAPLDEICCARLPRSSLAGLAELRITGNVTILDGEGDTVWVRWTPGDKHVLRCVLPLAGVELYLTHDGLWYPADRRLPTAGPPPGEGRRLDRVLQPSPFHVEAPPALVVSAVRWQLVRDAQPRSATALRCPLASLQEWADRALTQEITALRGAWSNNDALVVGDAPPWLADGQRYWGQRVLIPLGWWLEPNLPESAWATILGLEVASLALLREDGFAVVTDAVLQPLTRGAIRRAGLARTGEGAWIQPR